MKIKKLLSAAQPTGELHIGNYLGAIRNWVEMQNEYEGIFFIADMHAITIPNDISPEYLRDKTQEFLAIYLACGLDPNRCTLFVQSSVMAHTQLSWILSCMTPLGWLNRMVQFKSKAKNEEAASNGLFSYPVLQAADILLYDPDFVPVGEDQKQHLELTRDIAARFNALYGEDILKMPEPLIPTSGARIMGLDDPSSKMSKSVSSKKANHAIGILDDPSVIIKAVKKCVTGTEIDYNPDTASPGVRNLMEIYALCMGKNVVDVSVEFDGHGYGYFKTAVGDAVVAMLEPIQDRYREIRNDPGELEAIARNGARKAEALANPALERVQKAVGFFGI